MSCWLLKICLRTLPFLWTLVHMTDPFEYPVVLSNSPILHTTFDFLFKLGTSICIACLNNQRFYLLSCKDPEPWGHPWLTPFFHTLVQHIASPVGQNSKIYIIYGRFYYHLLDNNPNLSHSGLSSVYCHSFLTDRPASAFALFSLFSTLQQSDHVASLLSAIQLFLITLSMSPYLKRKFGSRNMPVTDVARSLNVRIQQDEFDLCILTHYHFSIPYCTQQLFILSLSLPLLCIWGSSFQFFLGIL